MGWKEQVNRRLGVWEEERERMGVKSYRNLQITVGRLTFTQNQLHTQKDPVARKSNCIVFISANNE